MRRPARESRRNSPRERSRGCSSRVSSMRIPWIAFIVRADCSGGINAAWREMCPMPCFSISLARSWSIPSAASIGRLHKPPSCANLSSSVIRVSRSSMRASIGSEILVRNRTHLMMPRERSGRWWRSHSRETRATPPRHTRRAAAQRARSAPASRRTSSASRSADTLPHCEWLNSASSSFAAIWGSEKRSRK